MPVIAESVAEDVDLARGELEILHIGGPSNDFARDSNHIFIPQCSSDGVHLGIRGTEDDLRNAVTVSQIDEYQSAEIPVSIHPAAQRD